MHGKYDNYTVIYFNIILLKLMVYDFLETKDFAVFSSSLGFISVKEKWISDAYIILDNSVFCENSLEFRNYRNKNCVFEWVLILENQIARHLCFTPGLIDVLFKKRAFEIQLNGCLRESGHFAWI